MDEPGEHMIYVRTVDGAKVSIEVRWFRDWASWNFITEKEYKVVFSTEDTILNFSTQVFENAERLLSKYGLTGYKAKWIEHDFPADEYGRLKALLKG